MSTEKLRKLPINRAVVLDNVTCPYCGKSLTKLNDTKEHVIGRRFVPKGALNQSWNLIVRACHKCNSKKSLLENDISAITLAGKHWFSSGDAKEDEVEEAKRKVKKSTSWKTGRPVASSQEEVKIEVPFGPGVTFKFNMVAPPQIDTERIFTLAQMQMMAFFYFITFDHETKRGGFWPQGFYLVSEAHHGDWGNPLHRSFMKAVLKWKPRWIGNTAKGYFKSIIRRHPDAECWSWALEWNNNYRVVGFFGDRDIAQSLFDEFEKPQLTPIQTNNGNPFRFRSDAALNEDEDLLFVLEDGDT